MVICCLLIFLEWPSTGGKFLYYKAPSTATLKVDSCYCRQKKIKTNVCLFPCSEAGARSLWQSLSSKNDWRPCNEVLTVEFRLLVGGWRANLFLSWILAQSVMLCYTECVSYSVIYHASVCLSSLGSLCVYECIAHMLLETSNLFILR